MNFKINFISRRGLMHDFGRQLGTKDIMFMEKCLGVEYIDNIILDDYVQYKDDYGFDFVVSHTDVEKIPGFVHKNRITIFVEKEIQSQDINSDFLKKVITRRKVEGSIINIKLTVRIYTKAVFDYWLFSGQLKRIILPCRNNNFNNFRYELISE